jgi:ferredoxin
MAKKVNWIHRWRRVSQFFFLIALNPWVFMYRGFCMPAMNCWACPAAAFGCPIGAIGNFLVKGLVPFFAIGLMLLVGALVGRLICGWVCPFGLLQDLLAKIPVKKLPFPRVLSYGKYVFLVVTVFLIPILFGIDKKPTGTHASDFFFCNYCPAGTLEAAIPVRLFGSRLAAQAGEAVADAEDEAEDEDEFADEDFGDDDDDTGGEMGSLWGDDDDDDDDTSGGEEMGGLWGDDDDDDTEGDDWLSAGDPVAAGGADLAFAGSGDMASFLVSTRMWVLYAFLLAFVFIRRPFCRGFCPIGAMFALLNRFSFFRMRVKVDLCKSCDVCAKKCPVDNKVYMTPSSDDCIRCLECTKNCSRGGVECGLLPVKAREEYWE